MSEKLYRRYFAFIAGILLLLALLGVSLWQRAVHPQEDVQLLSEDKTISTEILRGSRGRILGSQGEPLAFEEPSYSVQFRRDDGSRKQEEWRPYYTNVFSQVIDVVEKYGLATVDTFAIVYDEERRDFVFNWGNLGIEDDPLALERAIVRREENWRKNMLIRQVDQLDAAGNVVTDKEGNPIKVDLTPKQIYQELRTRFYIPEEYSYEEARKLLSIWQDVQLSGSTTNSVAIANNVPMEAVAELESRYGDLDGVFATATTRRVYPKGDLVAHIIGYTGRITDNYSRKQSDSAFLNLVHNDLLFPKAQGELTLEEMGYGVNDLTGKEGLEKTQEQYLTGSTTEHHGKRTYETSSNRIITRIIEAQQPTNGNDIYLTLDMGLQELTTTALLDNIAITRQAQEEQLLAEADQYRDFDKELDEINLASFGAAVVLDAKTGRILAMVSVPSYDNNLFVGGIDATAWENIRDNALLNNWATTAPRMPGSIFKMAVGLAGLEEGAITLDTVIDDEGPYDAPDQEGRPRITSNQPRCWVNPYYQRHNHQTIVEGLANSCNYFFFETANRLEWQKDYDSPDDYVLGRWAGEYLGMAQPTGVEIPESVGQVGGQNVLYNNEYLPRNQRTSVPILVYRQLVKYLSEYCVYYYSGTDHGITEENIGDCAQELMALVGSDLDAETDELGPYIREIMAKHTGIPQSVSEPRRWSQQINDSLGQLRWNINQIVRSGIGQGVVTVTPLAAARYVATLINGGYLYETHIIDRIVDPTGAVLQEAEPVVSYELNANPAHLDAIKRGMRGVVSEEDGGTAANAFEGFAYNGQFGGKTGTAQISAEGRNIDLENTSWMVAFAPYEEPEIVVAVCIPYGWKGSMAAPTVKSVIEYWLTRQEQGNMQAPPSPDAMLP